MIAVQIHDSGKTPLAGIVFGYLAAVLLLSVSIALREEIRLFLHGFPLWNPLRYGIFVGTGQVLFTLAVIVTFTGLFILIPFSVFRRILGFLPNRRAWHFALAGASTGVSSYGLFVSLHFGAPDSWSEPAKEHLLGDLAFATGIGVLCGLTANAVENLIRRKSNTE